MYVKDKSLFLKSSASPFTKNLSALNLNNKIYLAIAHKNVVNLIIFNEKISATPECKQIFIENKDSKDSFDIDIIIQVKWVELESFSLLIVALHKGIKIYKSDGSEQLLSYTIPTQANDYADNTFTSGITVLNPNVICIGSSNGSILKFFASINKECVTYIDEIPTILYHKRPIYDLTSDNSRLISCDDTGIINIWEFANINPTNVNLEKKVQFNGYNGFACNCLALHNNFLWAGYASGHLRVFDMKNFNIICEISAHTKWLTSLHIAAESGLVLSTSEDSFVRVWSIGEENESIKVSHEFTANIANSMIFGGRFLNKSGNAFCAVGYDSNEVYFFKRLKA